VFGDAAHRPSSRPASRHDRPGGTSDGVVRERGRPAGTALSPVPEPRRRRADVLSDRPFDRRAAGLNHLACHAASREQVDELAAGVRERADATLLYEDRHPFAGGYYALYCEDPEGLKVEVVGPDVAGSGSGPGSG
jgi:hypothetical protein